MFSRESTMARQDAGTSTVVSVSSTTAGPWKETPG
jgi:hypothetical protein